MPFRASALFRVLRLFFAYFFLARQKKVCRRRHSYGVTVKAALRCNRRSAPRLRRGRADSTRKGCAASVALRRP